MNPVSHTVSLHMSSSLVAGRRVMAATALTRAPVSVTLLDRHNHHLFQPLLYQVATATLSPGDIASPIRWILRHARNVRVLLGDVRAIDTRTRRIRLEDDSTIDYDFLIVATGASHTYFGHDEWAKDAPGSRHRGPLAIRPHLVAFEPPSVRPIRSQQR